MDGVVQKGVEVEADKEELVGEAEDEEGHLGAGVRNGGNRGDGRQTESL